jgi:hypothetical protein
LPPRPPGADFGMGQISRPTENSEDKKKTDLLVSN